MRKGDRTDTLAAILMTIWIFGMIGGFSFIAMYGAAR